MMYSNLEILRIIHNCHTANELFRVGEIFKLVYEDGDVTESQIKTITIRIQVRKRQL